MINFILPIVMFVIGLGIGMLIMLLIKNNKSHQLVSKIEFDKISFKNIELEKVNIVLQKEIEFSNKNLINQESYFQKLQAQVKVDFENISNRIFADKQSQFTKVTTDKINDLLSPLKNNIDSFQKNINDKYLGQSKERLELKVQIEHMMKAQAKLSLGAENLTNALKGENKTQGNWGEMILENILSHSGLSEPHDYIREGRDLSLKNENGQHMKPDVIINLPEGKCLIIDSKVSLTNYERYCSLKNEVNINDKEESKKELLNYINSIKNHIKELAEKKYHHLNKLTTPEFVLMFMPIEGAFSLAISNDVGLFEYAWDKQIILVCPSTLLATLKTTASVWKFEKQQKNAVKIAVQAGKLYDKFEGFLGDLQEIKKQFVKVNNEFDYAFNKLSSGRGNLISQVEKLKDLGAKTSKQIDENLL